MESSYRDDDRSWRYYVHDGRVFCPSRTAEVDVDVCSACAHLASDPSSGSVVCLPPPGDSLSEMIEVLARY